MQNKILKDRFLLLSVFILIFIVTTNSMASFLGGYLYYIFYQGIYGIILSIVVPLIYVFKYEKGNLNHLGIKTITKKSILIALIFIVFSVGGQLIQNDIAIPTYKKILCISIPLIMTTFFEEFLFRGFFQVRFEKYFGVVFSIVLSGLIFSLYHLGYPSFRKINSLLTLFLVGIMFATAFKLANNNLFTSFLVNLPNAVLTYLLNTKMFPNFTMETASVSFVTIILVMVIFIAFINKDRNLNVVFFK